MPCHAAVGKGVRRLRRSAASAHRRRARGAVHRGGMDGSSRKGRVLGRLMYFFFRLLNTINSPFCVALTQ